MTHRPIVTVKSKIQVVRNFREYKGERIRILMVSFTDTQGNSIVVFLSNGTCLRYHRTERRTLGRWRSQTRGPDFSLSPGL